MTAIPAIAFDWDGEVMRPRHPRLADRHFVIGETYRLAVQEDRSSASHAHFFASIAEAHTNLPDEWAQRLPTPEHLRRFALIKAGFADSQTFVASSRAEAQRLAAFIRPVDEFAVVTVEGPTVTRYVAKSQSYRAMGKADFQASKDAVLSIVSAMIGVTTEDLGRAAAGSPSLSPASAGIEEGRPRESAHGEVVRSAGDAVAPSSPVRELEGAR